MAKQLIGIGTLENDGTGDTLRVAFDKVNDNFTEAYNFDINQLSNVDTSANGGLANGKVLAYDSSSGKFEPSSLVYASNLTDLADVVISSAAAGEVIRHNGTTWVDATLSTLDVTENTNLYYTDARADARVTLQINALVDSAPSTLDTLNELAAALNDDTNYGATITTALAGKEPTITAGSTAQYWRGDKSFQTLNTSIVPESTNLYYTNVRADARIAAANIGDLANVDTTGVIANSVLKYNTGTSKFVIGSDVATLADLTDTTITAPATNALLQYNGSAWIDAVPTTAHITEGANLYFTNARADARADLRVDAGFAAKSTTNLSEGTNLYYTDVRADARITAADTGDLSEGSNLYYTDARVNTRIAASSVNALSDVTITSAVNNQLLQYNSGSSQWVNVAQAVGGGGIAVTTESFNGTGVQTAFTITATGAKTNNAIVSISGVIQKPTTVYAISGQTLTFTTAPPTGTGNIEVRFLASGEGGFLVISASQAVVAGGRYAVNTSGSAVTCTLPGSPAAGDAMFFADAGGAFATNNLTIARNGNTIMGLAQDMTVSTNNISTGLLYSGSDWRIY